jgi:hypothetical protein
MVARSAPDHKRLPRFGAASTAPIFDPTGKVPWNSGNLLEHFAMRNGHYPVKRAKGKGVEPEGIEIRTFGPDRLIFVNAERGNFVALFADKGADTSPEYLSSCPLASAPRARSRSRPAICSS